MERVGEVDDVFGTAMEDLGRLPAAQPPSDEGARPAGCSATAVPMASARPTR